MDDLFLLFEHIRSNNIELITDANQKLTYFVENPENIELLFEILQNPEITDIFFLQQTSILIKNIIRNNLEYDFNQYVHVLLELIQSQSNQTVKETLISSLSIIESTDAGKGLLNELLRTALSDDSFTEQTSRCIQILSESEEQIDPELIEEYSSMVSIGIENGFIYYSLLLGYKILETCDDSEFIGLIYNTSFSFLQQCVSENKINEIIVIANKIETILEKEYDFIDYLPLIQFLIEYIDQNEECSISSIFCDVMTNSVCASFQNGSEYTTEDEMNIFMSCLNMSVQKYLEISNDYGNINDIDFFERICVLFSRTNQEFIAEMLGFMPQLEENKDYIASFIISLTYCYKQMSVELLEEVNEQILLLLLNSLINPKQLVVEASVVSLHVLFESCPFLFDMERLLSISMNLLQSLSIFGISNDYLECIQCIFKAFKLNDGIVAKYFDYFSSNINESDLYTTSFYVQCLSSLIFNSPQFVHENFQAIYELLTQQFLMDGNDYIKPFLFQCFSSLCLSSPDLFVQNALSIVEYITTYFSNDDKEIASESLKAISKVLSKCFSAIDPSTIIEHIAQILNNPETNSYICALSLSVFVYIANLYKDNNVELLPLIASTFENICSSITPENSLLVARSLINYAQLCEQYDAISSNVMTIAKAFLEQNIDSATIAEVYSAFVPLIQSSNHDIIVECLNTFLPPFFNNDLPNGNGIDCYDSHIFYIINYIIRISIQELETESFSFFSHIIEVLMRYLDADSFQIKEFVLQILGQLFEMQAPDEYLSILPGILNSSIEGISNLSPISCYALQQICNGNPSSLSGSIQQIMDVSIHLIQENLEKSPFFDSLFGLLIILAMNSLVTLPEEILVIIINYGLPEFNDYESDTFESFYAWCKTFPNLSQYFEDQLQT